MQVHLPAGASRCAAVCERASGGSCCAWAGPSSSRTRRAISVSRRQPRRQPLRAQNSPGARPPARARLEHTRPWRSRVRPFCTGGADAFRPSRTARTACLVARLARLHVQELTELVRVEGVERAQCGPAPCNTPERLAGRPRWSVALERRWVAVASRTRGELEEGGPPAQRTLPPSSSPRRSRASARARAG
jgi:hypothetical protein